MARGSNTIGDGIDSLAVRAWRCAMRSGRNTSATIVAVALSLLASSSAAAADLYWNGGGTVWGGTANWSTSSSAATPNPTAVPTSADMAFFNIDGIAAAQTLTLDAAQAVNGLIFRGNATGGVTIQPGTGGSASILTVSGSGVAVQSGAGLVTIASGVALSGSQAWTASSSNGLTVSGPITDASGTNALNLNGTGPVRLTGSNSFKGGVTVTSGSLFINNASALGTGTLTLVGNNARLLTQGNSPITINNAVRSNLASSSNFYINTSGGDLTFAGALTGSNADSFNGIFKSGSGTLTINNSSALYNAIIVGNGRVVLGDANGVGTVNQITVGSFSETAATETALFLSSSGDLFNGNVAVSVAASKRAIVGGLNTSGTVTFNQNVTGGNSAVYLHAETGGQVDLRYGFANSSTANGIKVGGGTVRVVSSANKSTTGTMTIAQGTWLASVDDYGTLANGSVVANGATSNGNGGSLGFTPYTTTVNLGNAADTTASDTIALLGDGGSSATNRLLGHNLSINSQNTSGTTTLGSRTGHTLFTGTISLNGRGVQLQSGTGSATFNGPIVDATGTNGITKIGSGSVVLGAANTYSGATRISSGTLALAAAGSIANSGTVTVGTAGSSGVVLDLTAKTGTFAFGATQTLGGIGTINIGAGKTVSAAGIWAPGNSIGSNAVTGNLTVSGTSQFELGAPGSSTTSPGTSDFTAVSGTLALGGALTLLDNANANSQGSYGAGAYRLFTYGAVSGSYASVASANASTRAAVVLGGSGTGTGQGLFANVYNLAVGSITSGTSVDLGLIHAGGSFTAQSLSIANTATASSFSEGLDASVSGVTGSATSGGSAITNLAAGSTATTVTVSLGDTTAGAKNGTVTVDYQSNGTVSGLTTIAAGSQTVNVTGSVFSGTATWNVNGGGSWGTVASGTSWTSAEGIKAAPGTFVGYTNTDSATFGSTLTSGTGTILLNGAAPSLAALVFSNTTGRYVLDQGSGGSLTLAAAAGKSTVDVVTGGLHEIKTAILGSSGLEKLGGGVLVLSGSSTYSGSTDITAGTLAVNGGLAGAVTVANGATLAGSGGIGGLVTVAGGGILAPGNSPGTLTMSSGLLLSDSSILSFELNASDYTIGGGINDLIVVAGNFTLDGILNVTGLGDFSTVADNTKWRLFNYSGGSFADLGLTLGTMPSVGVSGKSFQIDTATVGQVNLVIVPEPSTLVFAAVGFTMAGWWRSRRRLARATST